MTEYCADPENGKEINCPDSSLISLRMNIYLFNIRMCHVLNFQMIGINDKGHQSGRRESSLRAEMIRKSLRKNYSDSALKIRRTEVSEGENGTIKTGRCLNGMLPNFFQEQ